MELTYLIGIVIVTILVAFLLLIRKNRKNKKTYLIEKYQLENELKKAIKENDTKNIVNSNLQLIERHYEQNLSQQRTTYLTTLAISVLGVITILFGVIIAFQVENQRTGHLTTISGVVVEIISAIFFYQNRKSTDLIKSNHQSLVSGLDIQNAISLTEMLPKADKNKEIQKIIRYLLNRAKSSQVNSSTQESRIT